MDAEIVWPTASAASHGSTMAAAAATLAALNAERIRRVNHRPRVAAPSFVAAPSKGVALAIASLDILHPPTRKDPAEDKVNPSGYTPRPYYPVPRGKVHTRGNTWSITVG